MARILLFMIALHLLGGIMAFPPNMENSPNALEDHSNLITKDDDKDFRDVLNKLREEIIDAPVNTATTTEASQTLEESTKSNDQAKDGETKEEDLPMPKSEQMMAAMLALPMLRMTEMMLKDMINNPQATRCGCSSQHVILPPPVRPFSGSSASPSCGGCMRSSCTDCKRIMMAAPMMMPPPAAMIIRMMSTPRSSIYSPPSMYPSLPALRYPVPSYPMPAYPAPSYPAPSYPAPSYPAPSYPAPSYPAPSYPAPSSPAPSYAPSYPGPPKA